MMGFGPMGSAAGANSSSSTSNLSALAPPFTVDRLNPKPNSNPNLHYPDSPYTAEPYSHGWQYASPSAPIPELVFESTGITSVPLSDDYRYPGSSTLSPTSSAPWSAIDFGNKPSTSAFAYGGEVKPYYSPYVPPSVGEESLLVEEEGSRYSVGPTPGVTVKSQTDYTSSLFDKDYGTRWVDNLGFDDGKWAKRVEHDGSFSEKANFGGSHSYGNQLNQGGFGSEKNKKLSTEDSAVSYKKPNQVSDRDVHTGSLSLAQSVDKPYHEDNLVYFNYDSIKTRTSAYSSTYPEIYPSVLSSEMPKNFSNNQNSPFNSAERCAKPVDAPFFGAVSAMMPSATVVIRPPTATNGNFGQRTFSRKPARSDNVESVLNVNFGSKLSTQNKEDSSETNLFNIPKQGNGLISSSSRDPFDRTIKARFVSQSPNVNILGGFNMSCDNVQMVNPSENYSDFMDHQSSTAVDSPCWKGASSSQFSPFDIEAGSSNQVKKNLDEYYGFDREAFSDKAGASNKNIEHEFGAICSSKEHGLLGDAKGTCWTPTMISNNGIETSYEPNMPRKESNLLNDLTCGFDMKNSDTKHLIGDGVKMTPNDVSEGSVAVDAAEKVLASPASQEDVAEPAIPPDRKLNVSTVLTTIHNLSELLLFHLSSDSCSLEDENAETLESIISNLRSCLNNKNIEASTKPEPNDSVGDSSDKPRESRDVGTILGTSQSTNEASDSHIKLDCQHMHEEKRNYSFSGKKDEKTPIFSPLGDDLGLMRGDNMTKAIKEVLNENFLINEEMHSQALLFKNLWLDAEAKLCAISFKARFDRMKIQMEQIKIKVPQDNEDTGEVMSEVCISPDRIATSEVGPKGHDGPIPNPTVPNTSISSPIRPTDCIEASVMARFNILKSREDNVKPDKNMEEEQQPNVVDGEHEGSVIARFNILKSRNEILNEEQSKTIDGEFASEMYHGLGSRNQAEDNITVNVGPKLPRTGCPSEGKFGSYARGSGYETLDEFHLSINDDPIIHSFKNSRIIDQSKLGRRDSSTSEWEHVLKDDFSWKNT